MPEPSARTSRTWWIWALAFVAAWCAYLALFGPKGRERGMLAPPALEAPDRPSRADYSWTLLDLEGASVPFSKYRGRAVFLNIWATWCPPCVAELPSIANLAENPRLKNVAFVCVSTDESTETVRAFVRGKHWPLTVLRATGMPEVFATEGIPATYIIAPDGRIDVAHVGSAQWDDPSVVDRLERLASIAAQPGGGPAPAAP